MARTSSAAPSIALTRSLLGRGGILAVGLAIAATAADVREAFARGPALVAPVYRLDHVVDGDTVALRNGQRVRLVQIDMPEVFFGAECYGQAASRTTKRLLQFGSRVRLFPEPATDRVDQYGRLLRYVVRVNGGVNVNIRLVAIGAAAPYSYRGRRGRYANRLEFLAKRARARKLGLCKACPHHPLRSVSRRPDATLRGRGGR